MDEAVELVPAGEVLDLGAARAARAARAAPGDPMRRVEDAIDALAPLVFGRRLDGDLETEILAAIGSIASGMYGEAADRLERLAERLAAT